MPITRDTATCVACGAEREIVRWNERTPLIQCEYCDLKRSRRIDAWITFFIGLAAGSLIGHFVWVGIASFAAIAIVVFVFPHTLRPGLETERAKDRVVISR